MKEDCENYEELKIISFGNFTDRELERALKTVKQEIVTACELSYKIMKVIEGRRNESRVRS